jgi:hypothetical protein
MRLPMILVSFAFFACGGSSGGGGPTEAPITMTSAGLSSPAITIPSGGRVHFFNKDTANHQITSQDCTDLDTPVLAPNTDSLRPTMTGPLSCTFSDAVSGSAAFNGSVMVAAPGTIDGGSGY